MISPALASYLTTARRKKRRVARFADEPPGGTVGVAYAYAPEITGGLAPYEITLDAGALPDGLSVVDSVIEGTPTDAGSFTAWLKVVDANLIETFAEFEFGIAAA
jgi:hypothetical protein